MNLFIIKRKFNKINKLIPYTQKKERITAIILAGGKSSRMGFDKSLFEYKGKKIIQIIFDELKTIFKNILIISNQAEKYLFLDTRIYGDYFVGKGPLAGIHSGLSNSQTKMNFIISCDLPFINSKVINKIISFKTDKKIAIPFANNKLQPLCGLYSKDILPLLTNYLSEKIKTNNKKLLSINNFLKVTDYDKIIVNSSLTDGYDVFFNLNNMNDLDKMLKSK